METLETIIENLDILEKGKEKAPIGTIKKFGGRDYIQTAGGWKYHGKGGGGKAQDEGGKQKGATKFEAGHKITQEDGHTGTVKHQDETHTYVEHKLKDGKTKVSKVKNEDMEANVKAGKWEHHIPAGQAQKESAPKAQAAPKELSPEQAASAADKKAAFEEKQKEEASMKIAAEKMGDVKQRFKTFEMMVKGVATGKFKSALAYGTGGVGKTYTVTHQLEEQGKVAFDEDKHQPGGDDYDYVKVTGKATPTAVYKALYQHNNKIIVFDDCDSVLKNEDAINFFKGALDTSGDGTIAYGSSKKIKDENDEELPQRFKFKGKVIFVSNLSPEQMPQPLKSRATKIDLTMNKQQTIDRIKEIAMDPKGSGKYSNLQFPGIDKYSHEDMKGVIDYLDENKDHIGDLNVRTIGKILGMKQMADEMGDGKNWMKYADQEIFSKGEETNFFDGGILKSRTARINSIYKSQSVRKVVGKATSNEYVDNGGKEVKLQKSEINTIEDAFNALEEL